MAVCIGTTWGIFVLGEEEGQEKGKLRCSLPAKHSMMRPSNPTKYSLQEAQKNRKP